MTGTVMSAAFRRLAVRRMSSGGPVVEGATLVRPGAAPAPFPSSNAPWKRCAAVCERRAARSARVV